MAPGSGLLVRQAGMAGSGQHDPDLAVPWIEAVPDPASTGHLDLPLFQFLAADLAGREVTAEPMVPLGLGRPGLRPHELPGAQGIGGSPAAQLFPPAGRSAVVKPQIPLARAGRRRYPVAPLGTHSPAGLGTGP